MNNNLQKVFNKTNNIIIGALHFPPLLGYSDFPGFEMALKNALDDLEAFERGGIDAVIFENNYDIPHSEFVKPEIATSMMYLGEKLRAATKLPLGISVLWNDYKTALSIAKILNLQFIRVPVFVDHVRSRYGEIIGNPQAIIKYRKMLNAEDVEIYADIHVKHSEILSKITIEQAASQAISKGADGLIITGKWTGDAPLMDELKSVRAAVGDFPIIAGSGCDKNNIGVILNVANAAIVSTSLKEGTIEDKESDNLKGWDKRIDLERVKEFMSRFFISEI